jgi:hypothetical protein
MADPVRPAVPPQSRVSTDPTHRRCRRVALSARIPSCSSRRALTPTASLHTRAWSRPTVTAMPAERSVSAEFGMPRVDHPRQSQNRSPARSAGASDRPNLHGIANRINDPPGDLQGPVVTRAVQHCVAGQHLLKLSKRTVGHATAPACLRTGLGETWVSRPSAATRSPEFSELALKLGVHREGGQGLLGR